MSSSTPVPRTPRTSTGSTACGPVELVLLTHRHLDHTEAARTFAERVSAPVRALDPTLTLGAEGLAAGERLGVAGLDLRVLVTPGHTDDSLCLVVDDDGSVLTGDTVLGRGTTVLGDYDGALTDYLDSLRAARRAPGGHDAAPGARAGPRRRRRDRPRTTSRTASSGSTRSARRCDELGPETRRRVRSSRSSTRTSTSRCGRRPTSRWPRSSSTSRPG